MPEYTLTYFNLKGRAEPIRYMFRLAGVEFEDRRVSWAEWGKLKSNVPFGRLPMLEVDGIPIVQSYAIYRYVAGEFGFHGSNAIEGALIDSISETTREFTINTDSIRREKDETKKAELRKQVEAKYFPDLLVKLEKVLISNKGGDGWLVGSKVSFADISVYNTCIDFYPQMLRKTLDLSGYPKLAALIKRIEELPKMAEWIRNRPATSY